MVARIGRVDGDEGNLAQVLAALQRRQGLVLGLALHLFREAGRQAVGVDGDDGGGAGIILATDGLQDLAAFRSVAMVALFDRGQNQIAVAQFARHGVGDQQHILGALIDRLDAGLARRFADHAQDAVGPGVQPLDQAGLPALGAARELDQQTVAHARRGRLALAVRQQQGARRVVAALDQFDVELAVGVAIHDIGHAHGGQGAGFGKALAAALAEDAFGLQRLQHFAQLAAFDSLQSEDSGDVGLFGLAGFAQEGDQGVFVGQARSGAFRRLGHCVLCNALRGK
ncbi:hypothetical protein D3C85_1137220 [compost metagenome]